MSITRNPAYDGPMGVFAGYGEEESEENVLIMPKRCPECGSKEVFWDDDHEMVDCFGCGIWFDPQAPENKGCFDSPDGDLPPMRLFSVPNPRSEEEDDVATFLRVEKRCA